MRETGPEGHYIHSFIHSLHCQSLKRKLKSAIWKSANCPRDELPLANCSTPMARPQRKLCRQISSSYVEQSSWCRSPSGSDSVSPDHGRQMVDLSVTNDAGDRSAQHGQVSPSLENVFTPQGISQPGHGLEIPSAVLLMIEGDGPSRAVTGRWRYVTTTRRRRRRQVW